MIAENITHNSINFTSKERADQRAKNYRKLLQNCFLSNSKELTFCFSFLFLEFDKENGT